MQAGATMVQIVSLRKKKVRKKEESPRLAHFRATVRGVYDLLSTYGFTRHSGL
jgi:hypothetical protein